MNTPAPPSSPTQQLSKEQCAVADPYVSIAAHGCRREEVVAEYSEA